MAGKKWRFWPKSAIFFPVNNFPAIKKPQTQLFGFLGGMGHDILLLICPINIFNYLFLLNGSLIEGKVADNKPRRSPIPSGGRWPGDQTQSYFQMSSTDHLIPIK